MKILPKLLFSTLKILPGKLPEFQGILPNACEVFLFLKLFYLLFVWHYQKKTFCWQYVFIVTESE